MNSAQFCPVGQLEKLLLATDGSQFSEGAIREAIGFAAKCSSKLYALSVLETNPEYETIGSNVFEKEEDEVRAHLDSIKERALREGVHCDTIFLHGAEPQQQIVQQASENQVDMIVIGRRGRKGIVKLLLGEVASKVIGHAPCKVLVVPRAAKIGYQTILVATDGSEHGNAAVGEAVAIAKRCGSHLIALSVMRDESERQEVSDLSSKALELAKKEGVSAEALTPIGRSFDVIVETAGGRGVDLIVMGTYGKTGLRKFLMGSSTEKVIGYAGCAVLVVK
ncbi:MAG TPA: universal stress protein [Thermodesulfovibrionales bacterium]|nr:universal stress protein [Thermodesulfovibrionales bacterium]